MAPNKFEEHIKDKLEQRTIQPSSGAWNRLENQLNHSKGKYKTKAFLWIGAAASLVGVLLVVSQFLKEKKVETNTPVIVETPKTVNQEKTNQVIAEETDNHGTIKITEELKSVIVKPTIKIEPRVHEKTVLKHVASIENKKLDQEEEFQLVEFKQEALSFEEQKINDVVAQVKTLKDKNKTVSDSEIYALLQQAQKEIRDQQLYNEKTGVVDAKLLLQDVEADLDKSFRDKVFKALKENFNFIKTAVAKRND